MSEHLASIRSTMRALRAQDDPLGSEAFASQLVAHLSTDGVENAVFAGFFETLAGRKYAGFLALLRALSTVVPAPELRTAATVFADETARGGLVEPRWIGQLGRVGLEQSWSFGDVFHDQVTVMCQFSGIRQPHALIGFANLTHVGGYLVDLVLTTATEKAQAGFAQRATSSGGLEYYAPTPCGQAAAVLATALSASYQVSDAPEEVGELRALLGARLGSANAMRLPQAVEPELFGPIAGGLDAPAIGALPGVRRRSPRPSQPYEDHRILALLWT